MNLTFENEINEENAKIFDSNIFTSSMNIINFSSIKDFSDVNYDFNEDNIDFIEIKKEANLKKNKSLSYNDIKNPFFIAKKRGRKNAKNINATHNKFHTDNLLRKIQNHYMNFIVSFLNEILQFLGINQKLYFLNYKFKFNITKNFNCQLKNKSIGDILCNDISPKYKKSPNTNQIIINIIKNYPIINSILSEKYLNLFKNIYYKSKRIINLKYYGFDKIIVLSRKVKMYDDLINKSYNLIKKDFYIKRMNECVARYFLLNSIFLCN